MRVTKRARLREYLEALRPALIDEAEFARIRETLAPVSEHYLRELLRDSGVPLTPLVEGVRQGDFAELERTLAALEGEYEVAMEAGDRMRARRIRAVVISAKDHARLAARNAEKRAVKEEMVLWMLTWLENPPLFASWLAARKRILGV